MKKEKITKVRIEIYYTTKRIEMMSDIMSHLDLGLESVIPKPIIITYSTRAKVDKKYKEKMVKAYKKHFIKDNIIILDIKLEIIKKVN